MAGSSKLKKKITTMIDEDVLQLLKEEASRKKTRYQTLLNDILKEYLIEEETRLTSLEKRVDELERKIKN